MAKINPSPVSRFGGFLEKAVDLVGTSGIYGSNGDASDATVAVIGVTANDLEPLDSTTAPLGSSATYRTSGGVGTNGEFVRTNGFSRVVGTVIANQAGNLYFDWSSDGVNVDYTDTAAVAANTGAKFSLEVVAPYVSMRYVNGSSAQTTFRMFSWLRRGGSA